MHVYREANRCVDWLAHQGHSATWDWVLVDHVPPMLGFILADDMCGACLPRQISQACFLCLFVISFFFQLYKKKFKNLNTIKTLIIPNYKSNKTLFNILMNSNFKLKVLLKLVNYTLKVSQKHMISSF